MVTPGPGNRFLTAFGTLFDDSDASIALLNRAGDVLRATASAQRWLEEGGDQSRPLIDAIVDACAELTPGTRSSIDVELVTGSGTPAVIEAELWAIADGPPMHDPVILAWLRDITEQREGDREATLLATLAVALGRTDSAELGITVTLEQICHATGWVVGEAWMPTTDLSGTPVLSRAAYWLTRETPALVSFVQQGKGFHFTRGQGLPGAAWVTERPSRIESLRGSDSFTRGALGTAAGLECAVAIPMIASGEVVAVLEFLSERGTPITDRLIRLVQAVTAPLALLIQQKNAEEAHRIAEAHFSSIVALADNAIISIDAEQRIVLFNWSAERVFGYRVDEVLGRKIEMLLPEDVRARHAEHIEQFARSHVAARRMGEREGIRGRRKNGEVFPAEASISRFYTGTEWIFTVSLRDMTERVRNEKGLQALTDIAAVLSATGPVADALERVAQAAVTGIANVCIIDVVGPAADLVPRPVVATAEAELAQLLRATPHGDALSLGALGTVLQLDLSAPTPSTPIPAGVSERLDVLRAHGAADVLFVTAGVHDRVHAVVTLAFTRRGAIDDLTRRFAMALASRVSVGLDRALLENDLRTAVGSRDRVLGIVSHDLRNPLSAVAMCLSGLHDEPPPSAEMAAGLIAAAQDAVGTMQRMIQDLLDTAALDAGRLSIHMETHPVDLLVRYALAPLQGLVAEAGVVLGTHSESADARVMADPDRIAQVISNLVGNAARFTDPGGRIDVTSRVAGRDVEVIVSDTGSGIAPDAIPHVFDRYWHSGRRPERGARRSTGLGLSIAKGIVEAHGGRIWVDSVLGVGSQFHFTMPLAMAHADETAIHAGGPADVAPMRRELPDTMRTRMDAVHAVRENPTG